ncbi:hypothetical protein FSP39_021044 [Pinctada imbricata]|uniref:Pseudouridine synthase RsuA/RluA-like domain-containing protein n=1 Tax=Pinctada imbricata TaxID=66713 RepID=A0AA88XTX9_PINIB|nr:hypothetical protein FSP39_021044 [Pinctada imbricata]
MKVSKAIWDTASRALKMSTRVFEKPEILYQCEHFVAIDKPYDIVVNSDDPDRFSVEKLMDNFYPHLRDKSCVHGYRLDNATSGILCLSLSKKSARLLSNRFKSRNITKHYIALVYGHLSQHNLIIDKKIGKDSSYTEIWRMCIDDEENCVDPKEAVTELICLEEGLYDGQPATKILLIPQTGRTHQLRVHCDHIGHRIVGDFTYSNREDAEPYRMMLHAYRLKFKHRMSDDHHIDIISKDPFTTFLDPKWQSSKLLTTYEAAVSALDHVE